MSLEKLTVRNFQCHRKLEIDLDRRITVITGSSDVGKSAVLRAFRWLCFNKPGGSAFIRRGAGRCQVHVRDDAGASVVREKGDQCNKYEVNGAVYTAFGTGTPDGVDSVLNLGPENFQRQHDPPFWFSLTPGEVARELNRIVALDLIDTTLSDLASESRKAKAAAEVMRERVEDAGARKKALAWVVEADKDLKELEGAEVAHEEAARRLGRCRDALEGMKALRREVKRLRVRASDFGKVVRAAEKAREAAEAHGRCRRTLEEVEQAQDAVAEAKAWLEAAEEGLRKVTKGGCPLCGSPTSPPSS